MLRLNRLSFLLMACCFYFSGTAQTTSCTADFNYSVANNNAVNFYAKDTLGAHHHWVFGDGSPAMVSTNGFVAHQYAQPGKYEVKHFIEKPYLNCHDSIVKIITVEWADRCTALFNYKKLPGTLSYQFYNSSLATTGIKKTHWNFGDGTMTDSANPSHIFAKPGTYNVCLQIETSSGCSSEHCMSLQVMDSSGSCVLAARYQYYRDAVNCKKIYFSNIYSPASASIHFTWNFGDGSSSHDITPLHIYAQPGKYYVCLVSESGPGCRKEYCDSIIVKCETSCNITAAWQHYKDSVDCKKIHFINQSLLTAAGIHFTWNFGDGASSHDINSTHIYSQPGRYLVCLVSESGSNCRKEHCDSITVNCATTCNLTARFETRHSTSGWNTIYFNNVSGPVNNIWQTYWSYGDGISSRDYNSVHTYNAPGLYQVCLKVIGLNGCTSNYCDTVRIVRPDSCAGKAGFRHDSSSAKLVVNFEAFYQNTAAKYYWNFGDGMAGQGRNTSHVYSKPGRYNVCLTVKNDLCSVEHCEEISVKSANGSGRVMLFPNPAVSTVSLDVTLNSPGQVSIRLLDGSGAVKASYSKTGLAGSNRFTLPVEKLSQGIYLVEIRTSNDVLFSRFIKG